MTVDTSKLLYFIYYFNFPICIGNLVTGATLDLRMLPFQRKIGEFMIERFWKPATGNMTSRTVRNPVDCKGFVMYIFMAGNTLCIQISEFLFAKSFIISYFDEMTFPTGNIGVFTGQGPLGLVMVKIDGCPGIIGVTNRTIILGVIVFTDVALMYILVAIHTSLP